jgi:hypothetical protein
LALTAATSSRQGPTAAAKMCYPTSLEGSIGIAQAFDGATVLLTGATGFVGSVVLERLLRTTNVERVYVLCRAKRGTGEGKCS